MNRRTLIALALGTTLGMSACHKNPPPGVTPTPTTRDPGQTSQPTTTSPTTNPNGGTTGNNGATTDNRNGQMRTATIGERIHFEYNIADIKMDDQARLDAKAAILKQFPSVRIRITGHADERGSDQYNIALGSRRASAAKDYLVKVGIDASRIETASLGREVPIDTSGTEAAFAQNRRDEFAIIAGSGTLSGQ